MQVCNSINSRKLKKEEKNVFVGVLKNPMYLVIQGIIIGGQMLMVTFGGRAVRVHPLSVMQHLKCLGIGATCLIVGFFVKFIPIKEEDDIASEIEDRKEEERNTVINERGETIIIQKKPSKKLKRHVSMRDRNKMRLPLINPDNI